MAKNKLKFGKKQNTLSPFVFPTIELPHRPPYHHHFRWPVTRNNRYFNRGGISGDEAPSDSVSSCRCQARGRLMVGAPSGGGGARDGQGQRGEWRLNFGG
ncbi:hypothetical protein ES288_A08G062900v1 [Gossypium darwinii]|uniref:Uncharacterized protein n=1 Tax=Gossypium darwinii TaxID=34276 RepID=A0A5D2FIN5_GOSDA|nr:hypothetical protein ES288_A08G062900v1 [Gossypium darwinii]